VINQKSNDKRNNILIYGNSFDPKLGSSSGHNTRIEACTEIKSISWETSQLHMFLVLVPRAENDPIFGSKLVAINQNIDNSIVCYCEYS